jgi:hypothetical protein
MLSYAVCIIVKSKFDVGYASVTCMLKAMELHVIRALSIS